MNNMERRAISPAYGFVPDFSRKLFAEPGVTRETRADGTCILRNSQQLGAHARCAGDWLVHWAERWPLRTFLAERHVSGAPGWHMLTYSEVLGKVEAIGTWMLRHGLNTERPVAVLSDNSIAHALISLAAQHVGVPVASVSPAYSLMSKDHGKLKSIISQLTPGAIFVPSATPFRAALDAIAGLHDAAIVIGDGVIPEGFHRAMPFAMVQAETDRAAVGRAFTAITPDTIAKLLFTSGSTGEPKGVVNTQRMMCMSQQAKAQLWTFLEETPPVILDWLPWSHTFGANHNFNLILRNGGTLYIDNGKPVPGLFERTIANIREVTSNVYFNVPRGFDMLVAAMKTDALLARQFFTNLKVIFYAGAALPQNLWEDLERLALATTGQKVAMVSAWGSTETSPLATDCHFQAERAGVIGVPIPGVDIKLVPNGDKREVRVRGPNVMPGYWRRDDLTAQAFDEEGFYKIGDAVRLVDDARPEKGLLFDGRVAEDFKLMSGTWVNVGTVRLGGIAALAPVAQDIAVTGHDREEIGFLVFANVPACRMLAGLGADVPVADVLAHPKVTGHMRAGLEALRKQGGGSSTYATRALLMAEAASIDSGEITDKGYINQRMVLARRADLVRTLYAEPVQPGVITL